MTRQSRPSGPLWHATPEWKRCVIAEMERQGMTRAELSRRVSVTDAAITVLFRESTHQSRLVPAINRALGLPPPEQVSCTDSEHAELDRMWERIDSSGRRELLEHARRLAPKA